MRVYFLGGPYDGQAFMAFSSTYDPDVLDYTPESFTQETEFAPGLHAQPGDIVMRFSPSPRSTDLSPVVGPEFNHKGDRDDRVE